ncbi:MAG: DUF2809 domain-containing protein [Cyanobacteria bacterium P01_F01_bin.150]
MKITPYYLYWALGLFIVEVYIAIYVRDDFIRPYMGDFLVVILIYALIRGLFKFSMQSTAVGVLIFSFVVEILQYFNIVELLGLGDSNIARIVIGTTFVWEDLLAYSLGIATALMCEYFTGIKLA